MFPDWWFHNKKRNEVIKEEEKKTEPKIQNPEDAEKLYQSGLKVRGERIDKIANHIVEHYADSLSNGCTMYAYPINPYLTGGYFRIPSEIRDELADKIRTILGERFVVSNLRNKDIHQEDAIIIRRKEEN